MRETSAIHQRQSEITEQVHHLLAGSASAAPLTNENAREFEKRQPAASGNSGQIVRGLKSLGPEQLRLIDRLQAISGSVNADELHRTLASCRKALADLEQGNLLEARPSQDAALVAIAGLRDSSKSHGWAAAIGAATISILVIWQWRMARRIRYVPAPLVAIVAATVFAACFELPVLYVEVPEKLLDEVLAVVRRAAEHAQSRNGVSGCIDCADRHAETPVSATASSTAFRSQDTMTANSSPRDRQHDFGVVRALPLTEDRCSSANLQAG